jgi:choline monooxygenase
VKELKPNDSAERVYPPGIGLKEALYFWVFPNLMSGKRVGPAAEFLSRQHPGEPDCRALARKTLTIFEWYFHDAHSEKNRDRAAKAIGFSDTVQREDMHICEAVQRGLQSATYDVGRYSVKRENGVHHFDMLPGESLRLEALS